MMDTNKIEFSRFIQSYRDSLKSIFEERKQEKDFFLKRKFSPKVLKAIMDNVPLRVAVPSRFGGRGVIPKECLAVLEASSYESLALTLIFGINIALFLEPFEKYGQESAKAEVFQNFMENQAMGGLMISEVLQGSDALNMQTGFEADEDLGYKIKGQKHWQGLTGMADYWLVAARENKNGQLSRDISLFMTDDNNPNQHINVEELYHNSGLYPIPYGKNNIDITVPSENKLTPESTGLKMFMDVLHRSRSQFPGMAIGFVHRLYDEAVAHCSTRFVSGKFLIDFDQVQHQLTELQHAHTICSAMCHRSAQFSSIENNLAVAGLEANTIKAFSTDLMQKSSQTYLQLLGAKGYQLSSLGSTGILDSRPFQIFEGPNEVLYSQIAEGVLKLMRRKKLQKLGEGISANEIGLEGAALFKEELNFDVQAGMIQRKLIIIGKIVSRVISSSYLVDMANAGFRNDMIDNSIQLIREEINTLKATYTKREQMAPIVDYTSKSDWLIL